MIFLGFSWLLKNIILPWYSDQIYNGVRIDGKWTRILSGEIDCTDLGIPPATMTLKQKGEVVTGMYTHGNGDTESDDPLECYRVTGKISNSFFTFIMQPIDNDNIDTSAGIFHVFNKDSKLQLRGRELCIDSEKAGIESLPIATYVKNNS